MRPDVPRYRYRRARPETVTKPNSSNPLVRYRAIRVPNDEALRAPTIAAIGRLSTSRLPIAYKTGGGLGIFIKAIG